MIAKTAAAGGPSLHPEVLAFSSSLEQDRALVREDLLGSLAHLAMLARRRIVPLDAARALHRELLALWDAARAGAWRPEAEEDVHMAVEAELTRRLGADAGHLHTARSRNDQVALDLRLHVREQVVELLLGLAGLVEALAARAEADAPVLLPGYTHRQRAQPISAGYWWCAAGAMFARDLDAFRFVHRQLDASPLGVGALAGTSLPTDREIPRTLLGFSRLTLNGLDTVGDRDFALDFAYAVARACLHAGRLATDIVDFASSEFGFLRLGDAIACGSSLMPQKRNPDVFELVRGKGGPAVGNLLALFTVLKGLPLGYNRDLQEDRGPLLGSGPLLRSILGALGVALPHVSFDRAVTLQALEEDHTQATDLAEALVRAGTPFRSAYQLVGTLVQRTQALGRPLATVPSDVARTVDPRLETALESVRALEASVRGKESAGGTGPRALALQISALRAAAVEAKALAASIPRLEQLLEGLREVTW
ncbi:MAG TPA: argininosuccinate lyase [Myxococcaceae bacterium]|nr:argininosuccinate lyase [Myxococcaceae bacterium]